MREAKVWIMALAMLLPPTIARGGDKEAPPWVAAGWSDEEAAAHLLDRLTFGPRLGDVDRVVSMGLEDWIEAQLAASYSDRFIEARLERMPSYGLSATEAADRYPDPGLLRRQAMRDGVLPEDAGDLKDREMRQRVRAYAEDQGFESQRRLLGEAMAAKLYFAAYSENQLREVLVDFWFNHFNVSLEDNRARPYIPSYERDAIRPFVFAPFRDMLGATARHPAMLHYLDNAMSTASGKASTTMDRRLEERFGRSGRASMGSGRRGGWGTTRSSSSEGGSSRRNRSSRPPRPPDRRSNGLNENYARELMELHTLGVEGGYSQQDVIEVARAFTGWAVVPPRGMLKMSGREPIYRRALDADIGFVADEGFLFRADQHDEGKKVILGVGFPAGRGIEEGEQVLDILARHPATARHLAQKLAARFVADDPPEALVDRLAQVYLDSGGRLQDVMDALVHSPEFWDPAIRSQKIKSPFELAISSLRALDARVEHPRQTIAWVGRMGQPLYAFQAPTGYPDRGELWVNTGSLLNRMNFGLELASGAIEGIRFDLEALNDFREPESIEAALTTYAEILMPGRDVSGISRRLRPVLQDPDFVSRLEAAADSGAIARDPRREVSATDLAHVVGVILGSPDFQRR